MATKIEPEEYNELGEIIQKPKPIKVYERTMSVYDQHRIHETKDLFEWSCSYCQSAAKKSRREYENRTKTD